METRLKQRVRKTLDERVMEKLLKQVLHFSTTARYIQNAALNNFQRSEIDWFQIPLEDGNLQINLWEPHLVILAEHKTTIICQGWVSGANYQFFYLTRDVDGEWTISDEPLTLLGPFTLQTTDG